MTKARIPDNKLAFFENNIAAIVGAQRACKRLAVMYAEDDEALLEVLRIAER